ncbi:MAG: hypothetical protein ACP5SB_00405 [Caldisericaceae bacterium]
MTLEELYDKEKTRIEKLSHHYARIFGLDYEELFDEGMLAVAETYARYALRTNDVELLRVSNKVVNRRMYKYARKEIDTRRD